MKKIINGGIYDLDLHGTQDAEFDGNHPTIIIKSVRNSEMYYVIPLTTYTDERWKKMRKNYCCCITSTNSIARIDKVKVLHRFDIHNRWVSNGSFIMPKPEGLNAVLNKFMEYMTLSTSVALSDYNKFYKNYNELLKFLLSIFEEYIFSEDIEFIFDENQFVFTFPLSMCPKIMFDDVRHIMYRIVGQEHVLKVIYDKETDIVTVNISNSYKKLLTLKEKYGIFNSTKGDVNKTSVSVC